MNTRSKHLPAKERRAMTVEAVIELAGTVNPADITTSAIAKHMNLTQGASKTLGTRILAFERMAA